jgi:hypothetical protein
MNCQNLRYYSAKFARLEQTSWKLNALGAGNSSRHGVKAPSDGPEPVIPGEWEKILRLCLRTLRGFLPEFTLGLAEGSK